MSAVPGRSTRTATRRTNHRFLRGVRRQRRYRDGIGRSTVELEPMALPNRRKRLHERKVPYRPRRSRRALSGGLFGGTVRETPRAGAMETDVDRFEGALARGRRPSEAVGSVDTTTHRDAVIFHSDQNEYCGAAARRAPDCSGALSIAGRPTRDVIRCQRSIRPDARPPLCPLVTTGWRSSVAVRDASTTAIGPAATKAGS